MSRHIRTVILLAAAVSACATATRPVAQAPGPRPLAASPAIHWTRTAAEHRALFLQTYRWAEQQLATLTQRRTAGTWAVILDADETVLDNSTYQKERADAGLGYSDESWTQWVRRREATALPGAASFIETVRRLGGRVVIVTNRTQAECEDTRQNFRALEIRVDLVLCRPADTSDKNPRFAAVQNGTAMAGLPPLEVVMWVGDNIQDFPGLNQRNAQADTALTAFGSRFIILPNPMYGSWERNPVR